MYCLSPHFFNSSDACHHLKKNNVLVLTKSARFSDEIHLFSVIFMKQGSAKKHVCCENAMVTKVRHTGMVRRAVKADRRYMYPSSRSTRLVKRRVEKQNEQGCADVSRENLSPTALFRAIQCSRKSVNKTKIESNKIE